MARIATNGDGFLAVWASGSLALDYQGVRAMLLDREGHLRFEREVEIAPSPAVLSSFYYYRDPLAVASNGNEYLVAYARGFTTHLVRVDREGKTERAAEVLDGRARVCRVAVVLRGDPGALGRHRIGALDDHGRVVRETSTDAFPSFADAELLPTTDVSAPRAWWFL